MELLDEEKERQIREFIDNYRAELILIVFSMGIMLISATLFLITPTQAKSSQMPVRIDEKISKNLQETYIYVDIAGAILYPDVYKLPEKTRLKSLIEKAGGYSVEANLEQIEKTMNMSRMLIDQEKVYVPKKGDSVVVTLTGIQEESPLLNINSASLDKLNSLIGVGKITAQKIVNGRPYKLPADLVTKKIIGKALFEKIKDQITL